MFALLAQGQKFVTEKKSDYQVKIDNKKFENIQLDIQNKFHQLKSFNPHSIHEMSFNSETDSSCDKNIKNFTTTNVHQKLQESTNLFQNKSEPKRSRISKKINYYKLKIKWLDIITTFLLVISTLIAQVENLYSYDLNLNIRITAIKVVNCIIKKDFDSYNSTEIDRILNVTDYLSTIDKTKFESVYIRLINDDYSKNLRYIIVILTIISAIFLILSRYFEYFRDFIYIQKNQITFFKTEYFWIMIAELLVILPIQYPGLNDYLLYRDLGTPLIVPYSSFLAVFSLFRVYFLLKLFKHLTKWTNLTSESICEKYACKANTKFAFKASQKENPFIILFIIFILTCYCLGMAVRNFELFYWENFENPSQNWRYQWNAMWFIFVSMTTVGYGDFNAKTQYGRFYSILACLVGVYFVSMMMVFLTNKSSKNEKEEKAFKLINRLKYTNHSKNLKSNLIYMFLKSVKSENSKGFNSHDNEYKYNTYKLKILSLIYDIKDNDKYIKSCDYMPTKEQLLDISEKLDIDIKNFKNELDSLKSKNFITFLAINETLKLFTEDQITTINNLKKNYFSMMLLYDTFKNSNKFRNINSSEIFVSNKFLFTNITNDNDNDREINKIERKHTNPQQWESKSTKKIEDKDEDLETEDLIDNDHTIFNNYNENKIRSSFHFMFSKNPGWVRKNTNERKYTNLNLIRSFTKREVKKAKLKEC